MENCDLLFIYFHTWCVENLVTDLSTQDLCYSKGSLWHLTGTSWGEEPHCELMDFGHIQFWCVAGGDVTVFESFLSPAQNAMKNKSSMSSGQPWCPSLEAAPVSGLLTVPAWVTSWSYWIEYKYRRTDLPSLFLYVHVVIILPLFCCHYWLFSTVCSFVADFLSTFYLHRFMYIL